MPAVSWIGTTMTRKQKIASLQEKAVEMAESGRYLNARAIRVRLRKDHPPALVSEAIGDEDGWDHSFAERLDDFCRQNGPGDDPS